jgi:phosphate-selective porin OprO/OprP
MFSTNAFKLGLKHALLASVMVGAMAFAVSPASAQTATKAQVDSLQQQIQMLQQQVQAMKDQVSTTQAQVKTVSDKQSSVPQMTFANGRPGWVSADGQSSLQFTGRLHFDVADYMSVSRAGTNQSLQSGVNARRARLGILGKVGGVWGYTLIGDFGGTQDSTSTSSSIIEDAHISYLGIKDTTIDLGYTDIPWTLGEATSSNDIMFIERSSAQAVAASFGGGDARSTLGVHGNGDAWWYGVYLTGPAAGAAHTSGTGSSSAYAGLVRFTYNPYMGDNNTTVHIGFNGADMMHAQGETLTLSDRPELRVDPTTFLSTGGLAADSGDVLGLEAAATYGNFYVDGEYFHYDVDRLGTASDVGFNGGYVEASYTFDGRRSYNKGAGAYSGVKPDHPLDSSFTGWGAWELAARYSSVDLNDSTVTGGKQTTYSAGINWYPNTNIRFMLDYLHAGLADKPGSNMSFDAIAARAQFAF